jgi:hypothetical protein
MGDLPPWRLHDVRRSSLRACRSSIFDLPTTEAILNHSSGSRAGIIGIYQRHDYADEKLAALDAWGAHVMALVEGRAPGKVLPIRVKA